MSRCGCSRTAWRGQRYSCSARCLARYTVAQQRRRRRAARSIGTRRRTSMRLAVMPADSLLYADIASALDEQLGHARFAGARTAIRAKISMEVAQLALECVSATDECYSQVGRFLQVDRLLWGQIVRDATSSGVKVTVVLLDVARGMQLGRAEEVFPKNDVAIGGLRRLVDRASAPPVAVPTGAALATGAHAMSTRVCGRCRRPLPAPSEGGAPAPCPFCAAQDAGRAGGGRAAQSRPPGRCGRLRRSARRRSRQRCPRTPGARRRSTRSRCRPRRFPSVQPRKREAPPAPTPPPVVLAPPPAPVVTILPPAAAPAPSRRRRHRRVEPPR